MNHTQKLIASIVADAILVLIFIITFWWFIANIGAAKTRLNEIKSNIKNAENDQKNAHQTETLLKSETERLERINQILIKHSNPLPFIENLEKLAKETKNNLSLDIEEGSSQADELVFRITIQGSEKSALQYLKLLELLPYGTQIKEVVFDRLNVSSEAATISAGKKNLTAPPTARLVLLIKIKTAP